MFTITEFLHEEVKPALGCTEPGAVALAVAKACEQLSARAERLEVVVSDNIFKNGIAVGVPGTDGARGNEIAAALAVFCGHSAYSLEVLKDATPDDLQEARAFIDDGKLTLTANGQGGV
ncbi:MAG: serine dehydratase subunit alpha family protein, partial [Fretibacterium sp.]